MLNLKKNQSKINLFLNVIISKFNFKFLVTLICFFFLGNSIYQNFDALADKTITSKEISWLSFGFVCTISSIILNAYAWKLLIKSIGCESNKLNIIEVFLKTNLFKYLPGGIWHFVSRYKALRLEFSMQESVESILLEPLMMLVAGLIFVPFASFNLFTLILCWSSTLLLKTGFRELIINKLKSLKANFFIKIDRLNVKDLAHNNKNTSKKIFYPYKSLLVEIIFIFFRFSGFFFCMKAFSIASLISPGELISYFCLAWIVGLIVPAAPGGVGVFESVMIFALGSSLPEPSLLASLLFYRIISTLSDISAALIYPLKKIINF